VLTGSYAPIIAVQASHTISPEQPFMDGATSGWDGWFCDGLLCGGETKIRTFTWWLDLAGT
jgi:hypothetical protein